MIIKCIVLKDLKRCYSGQFTFLQTFRVPVPYGRTSRANHHPQPSFAESRSPGGPRVSTPGPSLPAPPLAAQSCGVKASRAVGVCRPGLTTPYLHLFASCIWNPEKRSQIADSTANEKHYLSSGCVGRKTEILHLQASQNLEAS